MAYSIEYSNYVYFEGFYLLLPIGGLRKLPEKLKLPSPI
jgi:hypothetical protein